MYTPDHFVEDDTGTLGALIDRNNFGTLVSSVDGRPFATHLPFLFQREPATLVGHMARANPHWQSLAGDPRNVLAIFQGPHEYISPTWYGEPGVPTWNYTVVHVYGTFEVVTEPAAHRQILADLTARHEADSKTPWQADFDTPLIGGMLRGTVAFRLTVSEIEGKFKLSQNRPAPDRERVADALEERGGEQALGIAAMMRERQ